jgi:hypothetical protein
MPEVSFSLISARSVVPSAYSPSKSQRNASVPDAQSKARISIFALTASSAVI